MGNYTQASYCAVSILLHSIISGRPLDALAKEVESFAPYIREGNYGGIVLSIWEQTMLNLLHASWDSGAEVLKDLMVEARETNNEKAIGQIFVARLFLSYLFNRYGAAVDIILERDQHPVKLHSAPLMYETLLVHLAALRLRTSLEERNLEPWPKMLSRLCKHGNIIQSGTSNTEQHFFRQRLLHLTETYRKRLLDTTRP